MSESSPTGGPPSDQSPEYAEAYRRGYARAFGDVPPGSADLLYQPLAEPEPTSVLPSLAHAFARNQVEEEPSSGRPSWFVPVVFAGLVLLLLISAFGIGKLFSASVSGADTAAPTSDGQVIPPDGNKAGMPHKTHQASGAKYTGATALAAVGGVGGSCQSAAAVDAAGNAVRYAPENVADGDPSTAWRCDGSGVGETVTLDLDGAAKLGEVGLVAGYAKTDPVSGADRYAENNRITKVRWTFSDGSTFVQSLDGSATDRSLQTVRIPLTRASRVQLEVLATVRGPRDTLAISEIRLGKVAG